MRSSNRNRLSLGLAAGVGLTAVTAVLMGQGASTPARSETQYFVTGEGGAAHLWVREGTNLRCVGHGACAVHTHDESAHDHGTAPKAPKKP